MRCPHLPLESKIDLLKSSYSRGAKRKKLPCFSLRNKVGNKLVVWCQIVVDEKPPPYWRTKAQKQNVAGMLKVCEKVMTQMQPTIWQHSNPALGHRARHMARHVHIRSLFCTTQRTRRLIRSIVSSNETHLRMWFGATTQLKSHQITTLNSSNHNSETQYSLPQWASKQRKCLGHGKSQNPNRQVNSFKPKRWPDLICQMLGFCHRSKKGHVFTQKKTASENPFTFRNPIHPRPRAQRTWSA